MRVGSRFPLTACAACQALFWAFTLLSSLAVAPDSPEAQLALAVQPLLFAAFVGTGRLRPDELAIEEIAAVLAVEAANGFCIMAAADAEDGRRVRGSGVYLKSSRINHGVQAAPADTSLLPLLLLSLSNSDVARAMQRVSQTLRASTTSTRPAMGARIFFSGYRLARLTVTRTRLRPRSPRRSTRFCKERRS